MNFLGVLLSNNSIISQELLLFTGTTRKNLASFDRMMTLFVIDCAEVKSCLGNK